ncbi:Protein-disulfide isomerase [Formivibrio citricus]|uniref:Protein-disulfide isomerase n=1 Tax=Formivibrio citricus TaxID=83765 RepID=A0A1I5AU13_9NEIS|nr:thioredoxin domain-containing protein [Formivibrio citricus]SFN65948.1 Protein-disulfide isomerase [Formivibrio citricus]
MKRPYIVIASALVLVLAFAGGAYYFKTQQTQEIGWLVSAEESALNRSSSPSLGAESAKVQIVEFFDPACEACRMMYPYVKSLIHTNDGKVRLTLRYATFHDGSDYVVKVLEAARMQGQDMYWKALEAILANQQTWATHGRTDPLLVWSFLGGTGLDIPKAKQDMNDPRIAAILKQDATDLAILKINKTPSFFINGKPLNDFSPNGLRIQIKREISAAYHVNESN